jgi:alpha-tubulin suppressor-like RCC1 family protein
MPADAAIVKQLVAGPYYTCALDANGRVYCWGINGNGTLGNNDNRHSNVPVSAAITGVQQISAGFIHVCAVRINGKVACWGRSVEGQLGNGSTEYHVNPEPIDVMGLPLATQVAAGDRHTCLRTRDARIFCWGYNADGVFGNGTRDSSYTPVDVTSSWPKVSSLTAGGNTCALLVDGNVMCSGHNWNGELGDGSPSGTGAGSLVPVRVLPP